MTVSFSPCPFIFGKHPPPSPYFTFPFCFNFISIPLDSGVGVSTITGVDLLSGVMTLNVTPAEGRITTMTKHRNNNPPSPKKIRCQGVPLPLRKKQTKTAAEEYPPPPPRQLPHHPPPPHTLSQTLSPWDTIMWCQLSTVSTELVMLVYVP